MEKLALRGKGYADFRRGAFVVAALAIAFVLVLYFAGFTGASQAVLLIMGALAVVASVFVKMLAR